MRKHKPYIQVLDAMEPDARHVKPRAIPTPWDKAETHAFTMRRLEKLQREEEANYRAFQQQIYRDALYDFGWSIFTFLMMLAFYHLYLLGVS